jgi:hypothetical protein
MEIEAGKKENHQDGRQQAPLRRVSISMKDLESLQSMREITQSEAVSTSRGFLLPP